MSSPILFPTLGRTNRWLSTHDRGTFVVTGGTELDLTCTDTTTVTPDWKPGQIYSSRIVTCSPVDVTFTPTQVVG